MGKGKQIDPERNMDAHFADTTDRFKTVILNVFLVEVGLAALHECSQHYVNPYEIRRKWLQGFEMHLCSTRDQMLGGMARATRLTWKQRLYKLLGFRVTFDKEAYCSLYDDQMNDFLEMLRQNFKVPMSGLEAKVRMGEQLENDWNVIMKQPQVDPNIPIPSHGENK